MYLKYSAQKKNSYFFLIFYFKIYMSYDILARFLFFTNKCLCLLLRMKGKNRW